MFQPQKLFSHPYLYGILFEQEDQKQDMKIANTITVTVLSFIISLGFLSCGSAQSSNTPNSMETPTFSQSKGDYTTWVAGVQGGGAGINVNVYISGLSEGITLDKAYFQGYVAAIVNTPKGYEARFLTDQNRDRDITMSSDPIEEAVNIPDVNKADFPFELQQNDLGIQYTEGGTTKYTVIKDLKKIESMPFPSAPPSDGGPGMKKG